MGKLLPVFVELNFADAQSVWHRKAGAHYDAVGLGMSLAGWVTHIANVLENLAAAVADLEMERLLGLFAAPASVAQLGHFELLDR